MPEKKWIQVRSNPDAYAAVDIEKPEHQHSFIVSEWDGLGGQSYNGTGYSVVVTGYRAKTLMCPSCLMVRTLTGDSNTSGEAHSDA